jgi:hypothetical protein
MKQEGGLYALLEQRLKAAKHPLTAVALYDDAAVRELAGSCNRVSDYLANLWRKGRATRSHAADGGASRFAYSYNARKSTPVERPSGQLPEHGVLVARPNLAISETHDSVRIDLPDFTITIKKRLGG